MTMLAVDHYVFGFRKGGMTVQSSKGSKSRSGGPRRQASEVTTGKNDLDPEEGVRKERERERSWGPTNFRAIDGRIVRIDRKSS